MEKKKSEANACGFDRLVTSISRAALISSINLGDKVDRGNKNLESISQHDSGRFRELRAMRISEQSLRPLISASSACLPSQLFHCLSAIIAAELGAGEQPLVAVCAEVLAGVGRAAARVDAVGQLAGEGLRLDAAAMDELVLLEDVSAKKFNLLVNLTRKSLLGSAMSGRTAALPSRSLPITTAAAAAAQKVQTRNMNTTNHGAFLRSSLGSSSSQCLAEEATTAKWKSHHHNSKVVRKRFSIFPHALGSSRWHSPPTPLPSQPPLL